MSNPKPKLVAIDPGASGGIAYGDGNGTVQARPMLTEGEFVLFANQYTRAGYRFYMEKVGGFIPDKDGEGQPGSRMFVFGDGYGFIRGALSACGNPPVLVVPQRWQRGFPKFKEKRDRKNAFKNHAQKVFPHLVVTLATADALCLLHFAQAQESGQFGASPQIVANLPNGGACSVQVKGDFQLTQEGNRIDISPARELSFDEVYAREWCKRNGWPVPAVNSNDWVAMVKHWLAVGGPFV